MDKSVIGGPSQSIAATTENKSAIGRLDDLIDDFNKPMSIQDQQQWKSKAQMKWLIQYD